MGNGPVLDLPPNREHLFGINIHPDKDPDPIKWGEKRTYKSQRVDDQESHTQEDAAKPKAHKWEQDFEDQTQRLVVGFNVYGKCPACGHETSDVFPLNAHVEHLRVRSEDDERVLERLQAIRRPTEEEKERLHQLRDLKEYVAAQHCNCSTNHGSKIDAAPFGCGANWLLMARNVERAKRKGLAYSKSLPMELEILPCGRDAERLWAGADKVANSLKDSMSAFQSKKTSWATAAGALAALIGTGTLLGSRDTVAKLSTFSHDMVVGLTIVAVALVGTTSALGLWATVGRLSVRDWGLQRDLNNAGLEPLRQARITTLKLNAATWTAVGAFIAAAVASSWVLIVKDAPTSTTTNVSLVRLEDKTLLPAECGSLTSAAKLAAGAPGFVQFTPADTNQSLQIPWSSIVSIHPVDSCSK